VYGDAFEGKATEDAKSSPFSGGFKLIVGILAAAVGFLKLFSPYGNQIPVLGDLVPAVAGFVAGFMLLYGFYRDNGSGVGANGTVDRIGELLLRYKKQIGFACIAAAALHFLFPTALFL